MSDLNVSRTRLQATAEWLAGLKPGDEVAVRHGYVHRSFTIDTVERVMPSQVTVKGVRGHRFRKSDGNALSADNLRIVEPTDAIRAEVRADELSALFHRTQWRSIPLATLEAVALLLED